MRCKTCTTIQVRMNHSDHLLTQGSQAPPAEREERRLRLLLHDRTRECAALEDEALTVHRHLLEARETRDILTEKISRLYQGKDCSVDLALTVAWDLFRFSCTCCSRPREKLALNLSLYCFSFLGGMIPIFCCS